MKSINDIVPREYRNPAWESCPVPGRPWWSGQDLTRTDGEKAGRPTLTDLTREGVVQAYQKACAEVDAAKPLPFPGLRVGQVWAVRLPQTTIVLGPITAGDLIPPLNGIQNMERRIFDQLNRAFDATLQQRGWGQVIEGLGLPPHITDVALIHDPCRPDLVPWTGVL